MNIKQVSIMTAKEAREIASEYNSSAENAQYIDIKKFIESSAGEGLYSIDYYKTVLPGVIMRLEIQKYSIKTYTGDRDGSYTIISW